MVDVKEKELELKEKRIENHDSKEKEFEEREKRVDLKEKEIEDPEKRVDSKEKEMEAIKNLSEQKPKEIEDTEKLHFSVRKFFRKLKYRHPKEKQPTEMKEKQLGGGNNVKVSGQKRTMPFSSDRETKRPATAEDVDVPLRRCGEILAVLMEHDFGFVFNQPVDAVALKLPDYHTVIKHPMDLGTVKSRLDNDKYESPHDFASDVRLTFHNALTYNPTGNDVNLMASVLLELFEEKFNHDREIKSPATAEDVGEPLRRCGEILAMLMEHDFGWLFNQPVDAVALEIPDYHTVIKHPMDLGTVKSRLDNHEYESPHDFASDVRLTFRNALTYNPEGNEVNLIASVLLELFEEKFNHAYPKFGAEHQHVLSSNNVWEF